MTTDEQIGSGGASESSQVASPEDPTRYAARHLEEWLRTDNVQALVDNYGNLSLTTARKRVLEWAVNKARQGDLRPLLEIGIEDQDAPVRNHVNRLLDSLPVDSLIPRLSKEGYSPRERRSIAGILGRCKAPEAGRLLAVLAEHEDWRVRETALKALAHFPFTSGLQIPIFEGALRHESNPGVRMEAAQGLLQIGTPAAMKALHEALECHPKNPQIEALLANHRARKSHDQEVHGARGEDSDLHPALLEAGSPTSSSLARNLVLVAITVSFFAVAGYLSVREFLRRSELEKPIPGEKFEMNRKASPPPKTE